MAASQAIDPQKVRDQTLTTDRGLKDAGTGGIVAFVSLCVTGYRLP